MMRHRLLSACLATLAACASGCEAPDAPEYVTGLQAESVQFHIFDTSQGIYPSDAVTRDPWNPFLLEPPSAEATWTISERGGTPLGFYAWATVLVGQPGGEPQYYTALKLRDAYALRLVPNEQLDTLKSMAVAAFQSVLDNFPDSVSYLADGTTTLLLAPLAYKEIKALGKTPTGPWVEVTAPDGSTTIARVSP
ncbi:MAG: hypothetical protein MUF54_05870 [Polyangiaceae bacterium]|nr:hypothetical protein [Polyangiaceae bacterium]